MSTPPKNLTTETDDRQLRPPAEEAPVEHPRVHVMEVYEHSHAKYADLYKKLAQ